MSVSVSSRNRKAGIGMPVTMSFVLGTILVIVTLWLAWVALTNESVPIVGSARGALIAIAVVGMDVFRVRAMRRNSRVCLEVSEICVLSTCK